MSLTIKFTDPARADPGGSLTISLSPRYTLRSPHCLQRFTIYFVVTSTPSRRYTRTMRCSTFRERRRRGAAPRFTSDLAWEWNTFAVTDNSGKTVDAGKYVTVYRKKDGKWLIIRDIWNSDNPPAPATAPATAKPKKNQGRPLARSRAIFYDEPVNSSQHANGDFSEAGAIPARPRHCNGH
jgi:hypothetical protein